MHKIDETIELSLEGRRKLNFIKEKLSFKDDQTALEHLINDSYQQLNPSKGGTKK